MGRQAEHGPEAAPEGRYLYERLGEKTFQRLCNAVLAHTFSDTRCYPVGHSDGGRDATRQDAGRLVIYQVKWTSKPQQNPVTWLKAAINGEADNIRRLVKEGAKAYYLLTSVAGTAVPQRGSMDTVDVVLAKYAAQFGIPMRIWWRADIDARVDGAPTELKWAYSDMLAGQDLVRYLIDGAGQAAHDHALRTLAMKVIATQWDEDAKVKFKQVELTSHRLEDLFIDVEAVRVAMPTAVRRARIPTLQSDALGAAADYLLTTQQPFTLVRGEPGQGKSTLGQYLCQLHRAAYLSDEHPATTPRSALGRAPLTEPRLPLRIDLRDYASWLSGADPFGDQDRPARTVLRKQGSMESFIAYLLTARSGGLPATVATVNDIIERLPVLIVLDGLDEVARPETRARVVEEIDRFTARLRTACRPQMIVTTRPNVAGLAEPTPERFETIALNRLGETLRITYLHKWARARAIPDREHRTLERIFRQRSAEPHISQLADNPMQLTILLYLLHKRGNSVPANRTDLYTSYMETFLDREAEKTAAVDEHRNDLEEVTAYLGWHLQARAERDGGNGQLPTRELQRAILNYLFSVDKNVTLVDDLFTAVTDRVWALTSKVQGTFEFDVQPLREYFAARYLYDFAGADQRGFDRADVLRELVRRGYWLNTSRFFAGFAKPNELAGLVETLEEERDEGTRPRQLRLSAWVLLADGVFSGRPRTQRRAAELFLDDLSVRFIHHELTTNDDLPVPTADRGAQHLADEILEQVANDPASLAAAERLQLAVILLDDSHAFHAWWYPQMQTALGTSQEAAWLNLGTPFHCAGQLSGADLKRLALADDTAAAAALHAGLAPEPGSRHEQRLVQAVLNGHASEASCSTPTYAADLLRILRPQNFLRMAVGTSTPLLLELVGHHDPELLGQQRQPALTRLKERDARFDALQTALAFRKGQKSTTSPWSNAARALAALLGPCWLAAEITVIGAAATNFTTGGDITVNSQPLGPDPDYGRLLQELRSNRTSTAWWSQQYTAHTDPLSRATWALGLLAIADESVLTAHLPRIDKVLQTLPRDARHALLMSSSRLGATLARRLSPDALSPAAALAPCTTLAVAHYVAHPEQHLREAQLQPLPDAVLADMAAYSATAWPAHFALTARMTLNPTPETLAALKAHGPHASAGHLVPRLAPETGTAVLASPFDYPMSFVLEADKAARGDADAYLADAADDAKWFGS
ncbi:NACHT domain-containing protein [Streptomyces sp. NPDC100445]|uniref:NACHT domain-containing protein n=1 Tax=Streptomyces sp. NPDC100445 TaxID=3366102 RepID=UPI00381C37E9